MGLEFGRLRQVIILLSDQSMYVGGLGIRDFVKIFIGSQKVCLGFRLGVTCAKLMICRKIKLRIKILKTIRTKYAKYYYNIFDTINHSYSSKIYSTYF